MSKQFMCLMRFSSYLSAKPFFLVKNYDNDDDEFDPEGPMVFSARFAATVIYLV